MGEIELDYPQMAADSGIPIIDYKTSVVRVGDLANKMIQQKAVNQSVDFPLVQTIESATVIADSILRIGAYPLADVTLLVNRKGNKYQKGSLFKFSNNKFGIADMVCRVEDIEEDDLSSEAISILAKESVDYIGIQVDLNYETLGPVGSTHPPAIGTLEVITHQKVIELPYAFAGNSIGVFTIASREPSVGAIGYQIYVSTDLGGTYSLLQNETHFSPHGTLLYDYSKDTYTIDDYVGFEIYSLDKDILGINSITRDKLFTNIHLALLGDEIISFQTITAHESIDDVYLIEGVMRGKLDTVREDHIAGEDFFLLDTSAGQYVQNSTISVGADLRFKYVPYKNTAGDISLATALPILIEGRAKKPYMPNNLMADEIMTNPSYTSDIVLTWDSRVRGEGAGLGLPEIITDAPPTWEGKFEVEVYVSDILVRTVSNIDALTWTYTNAMNTADNGVLAPLITFKLSNYLISDNNYKYSSDKSEITVTKE